MINTLNKILIIILVFNLKEDCISEFSFLNEFSSKKIKKDFEVELDLNKINEIKVNNNRDNITIDIKNFGNVMIDNTLYYLNKIIILKNPIHKYPNSLGEFILVGKNKNNNIQIFYPIIKNDKNYLELTNLGLNMDSLKNEQNEPINKFFFNSINYKVYFDKEDMKFYKYSSNLYKNCETSINLFSLNSIKLSEKDLKFFKNNELEDLAIKKNIIENVEYNFDMSGSEENNENIRKLNETEDSEKKSLNIEYKINIIRFSDDKEKIPKESKIVYISEQKKIKKNLKDTFPKTNNINTQYMILYKEEDTMDNTKSITLHLIEVVKGFELTDIKSQQIPSYNSKSKKVLIYKHLDDNIEEEEFSLDLLSIINSIKEYIDMSKSSDLGGAVESMLARFGRSIFTNNQYIQRLYDGQCVNNRNCLTLIDLKAADLSERCKSEIKYYINLACKNDAFSKITGNITTNIEDGIKNVFNVIS